MNAEAMRYISIQNVDTDTPALEPLLYGGILQGSLSECHIY